MPDRITKAVREQVADRANYCCEYCRSQEKFSPDPFSVEHIIPKSKGGTSDLENLAYSCQGCNNRKYNHTEALDPATNTFAPIFHPRKQKWASHFQWNTDRSMLIGLTSSGRATIQKLDLNRKGLINLRKVLISTGKHPPDPF